jgi:hypothetical protein
VLLTYVRTYVHAYEIFNTVYIDNNYALPETESEPVGDADPGLTLAASGT